MMKLIMSNMQVVYNAVLRANRAVLAACAPGVVWSDMHLLANRFRFEIHFASS